MLDRTENTVAPFPSEHLLAIVKQGYSPTAMRVLIWLKIHALRVGRPSVTAAVDNIATDLGVHRNAVSRAFHELAEAGEIARVADTRRGAPTRTDLLRMPAMAPAVTASAVRSEPIVVPAAMTAPAPAEPAPLGSATAIVPTQQPAAAPISGGGQTLDPLARLRAHQRLLGSLPDAARALLRKASAATNPELFVPDPAWGLTPEHVAALVAGIPRKEAAPAVENACPRLLPPKPQAAPPVAEAIRAVWPRLLAMTHNAGAAQRKADEIACMVSLGDLGRGDALAGVRAGLALIAQGRWKTPKFWSGEWAGCAERALAVGHA